MIVSMLEDPTGTSIGDTEHYFEELLAKWNVTILVHSALFFGLDTTSGFCILAVDFALVSIMV